MNKNNVRYDLMKRQKGKCNICGKNLYWPYVLDHIKPKGLGGDSGEDRDNLQLLCIECNWKKTLKDLKNIAKYKNNNLSDSTAKETSYTPKIPTSDKAEVNSSLDDGSASKDPRKIKEVGK